MKNRTRFKPHHIHFAHGCFWGILVVTVALFAYVGITEGYLSAWLGSDFKIVNAHEVIQSAKESEKLESVMRKTGIATTVLVGTPKEALYYNGETGFTGYMENNEEILAVQKEDPSRFVAFCAIDPMDPERMDVARKCVFKGAKGFKLYSGHSFFYSNEMPLNDPRQDEFYAYLESKKLPLIFHVNTEKYKDEFEDVLKRYPNLNVMCPHFCLSSKNLQRLSYLLDTYPNLYTDISWGDEPLVLEGIARVSENVDKYRDFMAKYGDRFLFATDTVITDYEGKSETWLVNLVSLYRDLLEGETLQVFYEQSPKSTYQGLNLEHEVLKKIYEDNWNKFMGIQEEEGFQTFLLKIFK